MWKISRETKENVAYLLGGAGFVHQLLIEKIDRPFMLTASLALMGFPLILKGEEKLKTGNTDQEENS